MDTILFSFQKCEDKARIEYLRDLVRVKTKELNDLKKYINIKSKEINEMESKLRSTTSEYHNQNEMMKSIINKYIKKYYDIVKENNLLSEDRLALSLENKSFKKSQIDGLNISMKKGDTKESYITYKDIYADLFSSSGGKRTRKNKNLLNR